MVDGRQYQAGDTEITELSGLDIKNLRHHHGIRCDNRHIALCDMALRTHDAEHEKKEYEEAAERWHDAWAKQHTQRHDAETECERLREALRELIDNRDQEGQEAYLDRYRAELKTPPPEGETQGEATGGWEHDELPTADDLAESIAPHTPEQRDPASGPVNSNGDFYGLCPKCERSLEEHVTFYCPDCYTPQAHGDALAALDHLAGAIPCPEGPWGCVQDCVADGNCRGCAESSYVEKVRHHLTTSGVPEKVRRMPERWRKEALELRNGDTDQAHAEADTLQDCAGFLRDALDSAPADGWKLVPEEPTGKMKREYERTTLQPFSSGADSAWRNMIAAAPQRGGEYE